MAKYLDYFNEVTNDGRIFSYEDVINIPQEEDRFYREALDYQYGKIGFLTDRELRTSGDVVYVRAYTRDDGTHVRAHYRSKNGHLHSNPNKRILGTPNEEKAYYDRLAEMGWDSSSLSCLVSDNNNYNKSHVSAKENLHTENFVDYVLDSRLGPGLQVQLAKNEWLANTASPKTPLSNQFYRIALCGDLSPNDSHIHKSRVFDKINQPLLLQHIVRLAPEINKDTLLIEAKDGSNLTVALKKSKVLANTISANWDKIKAGDFKNKAIEGLNFYSEKDLNGVLGITHIYNPHVDSEGNLILTLVDWYDFAPTERKSRLDKLATNAYLQQEAGKLVNYVLLVNIKFSPLERRGYNWKIY